MRSWQLYGIAALLWAAIFLPGLGDGELKGEEARRILPARTMLHTGEWIVPYSEGKPYGRKPPLINWAIAASIKITGVDNEWAARLPSVLAVLGATLVILGASRSFLSDSGALFAALSYLSCVAQIDKGRLAEIEPLYVSLTAIATVLWLRFWQRGTSPWITYTVPWFILGVSILAKGPINLLFFYAIVIAILRDSGRLREIVRPPHMAGILIMTGVFAPWVVSNAQRLVEIAPDGVQAQTVWLQQLSTRLNPSVIDWSSYPFVPFQAALNFAPWALFPILFWRRITAWSQSEPSSTASIMRGLKWGILVTFLIVSLIPESRPRFSMPLFGPLAILTGWIAMRAWDEHEAAMIKWWGTSLRFLATNMAIIALVLPFVLESWIGAKFIGIVLAIFLFLMQKRPFDSLNRLTIGTTVLIASAIIIIAFDTRFLQAKKENVRPHGRAISAAMPLDAPLVVVKPGPQPFLYYIQQPYEIVDRVNDIPADTTYLLIRKEHRNHVLNRKSLASRGEPSVLADIAAADGKRYELLTFPR